MDSTASLRVNVTAAPLMAGAALRVSVSSTLCTVFFTVKALFASPDAALSASLKVSTTDVPATEMWLSVGATVSRLT